MAPSLFVLSSVLYIGLAGSPALVDDDIGAAHALVGREMVERHDYVVMYQNGLRYLARPPMHFWMMAAGYTVLGESDFATRLPVALAMVGLTLMTFAFGRRFFGERAGFYGGLAVATSAGMFVFTRTVMHEAIYALEFTAIFYLFLRSWTGSLDPRLGTRGAAAVCALAVLTRGLIGLLFPAAIIVVFITLTRGWHRWRELRLPSSIAIFLAIAVPWHVLAELRAPGFFWAYFVNEQVNRALGTMVPHDYNAVPLWLWWLEHFVWLFPWSFFAPLVFRVFPPVRTWRTDTDPNTRARVLLFVWTGVILLFFSIESGSRMEYYSFGAWPAMALLLGLGIARSEESDDRALRWISRALAALGALFALTAGIFLAVSAPPSKDIAADLSTHGTDWYQSGIAHIRDLTSQGLADLRGPLILAAASLFTAFLAAWILRSGGVTSPRPSRWLSAWRGSSLPRTSPTGISSRLSPRAPWRWRSTRASGREIRSHSMEIFGSLPASRFIRTAAFFFTTPPTTSCRLALAMRMLPRRSSATRSSVDSGPDRDAFFWSCHRTRTKKLSGGFRETPRGFSPGPEGRRSTSIRAIDPLAARFRRDRSLDGPGRQDDVARGAFRLGLHGVRKAFRDLGRQVMAFAGSR